MLIKDMAKAVCVITHKRCVCSLSITPAALRLLLQTGKDITLCPVCKHGKMELVATFIYHNGCLIDAAKLRNRGSPKIKRKYAGHEKT
jgi:hypothetical protein